MPQSKLQATETCPCVSLQLDCPRTCTQDHNWLTTSRLQVWQAIAEHLAKALPEVLVLVHPIHLVRDSAQQVASRQLKRRSRPSDVMTGMTAQQKRR